MNELFGDVLKKYNLLTHPFYLAWNEGRLSKQQVARYAGEWGSFIKLISRGWEKIDEPAIAAEEEDHFVLWGQFADSLGTKTIGGSLPAVKDLVRTMEESSATYNGALGALYAFEAQQPATAGSKLQGLRQHYSDWQADATYFRVHENDLQEPALLEEKIARLDPAGRIQAEEACNRTCAGLWDALTSIMEAGLN